MSVIIKCMLDIWCKFDVTAETFDLVYMAKKLLGLEGNLALNEGCCSRYSKQSPYLLHKDKHEFSSELISLKPKLEIYTQNTMSQSQFAHLFMGIGIYVSEDAKWKWNQD